jgi:hypothetical protein
MPGPLRADLIAFAASRLECGVLSIMENAWCSYRPRGWPGVPILCQVALTCYLGLRSRLSWSWGWGRIRPSRLWPSRHYLHGIFP